MVEREKTETGREGSYDETADDAMSFSRSFHMSEALSSAAERHQ